jgi:methyltransferase, FkbM family
MASSALSALYSLISAKASITPFPGWHLGSAEEETSTLRKYFWQKLKQNCVIRWLLDLRIYLYAGNETSRCIFLTGLFEPNEFYMLNKVLKTGDVFFDAGANIGLYSIFASKRVGSKGKVIAVEPSQREYERLKSHIEMNSLRNIASFSLALYKNRSMMELQIATEDHSGHNTLGSFGYESVQSSGVERVPTDTIDHLVKAEQLSSLNVLKMDIEGAECFALQGAESTLDQHRPIIFIELSDRSLSRQNCSAKMLLEFLSKKDYVMYLYDEQSGLPTRADFRDSYESQNAIAIPQARLNEFETLVYSN